MSNSFSTSFFVHDEHRQSSYKIIYGYPVKKHVPKDLITLMGQTDFIYETINMYGEMHPGYYGRLMGQLDGAYERLITSPDADLLKMVTLKTLPDSLEVPVSISEYLDMTHPPQLHVVLSDVSTVHYASGYVMYGHVCQNTNDDYFPDYSFSHTHVFDYHSHFVGVSLGYVPPLESHLEVSYKHPDFQLLSSSESDVIRALTTEYVVTDAHRVEAEELLNGIPSTSKVIFKNVMMFVPTMCHCCT